MKGELRFYKNMTSLWFSFYFGAVFVQLRVGVKSLKYWLFAIFGVQTLGAGVTQDEETSLEQISRQKIVEQIGFLPSYV